MRRRPVIRSLVRRETWRHSGYEFIDLEGSYGENNGDVVWQTMFDMHFLNRWLTEYQVSGGSGGVRAIVELS